MTESVHVPETAPTAAPARERGDGAGPVTACSGAIPIAGLAVPPGGVIRRSGESAAAGKEKPGLLGQAEEWVKKKILGEGKTDEDIANGLSRTSKVFAAAEIAIAAEDQTEDTYAQAKEFAEAKEKFEQAAKNGENIIKVKEYAELSEKFLDALDAAGDADVTTPQGARKVFELMSAGAAFCKKAFPPPFNAMFDFVANSRFADLANVKRAWEPDRAGGPHSAQWEQIDKN